MSCSSPTKNDPPGIHGGSGGVGTLSTGNDNNNNNNNNTNDIEYGMYGTSKGVGNEIGQSGSGSTTKSGWCNAMTRTVTMYKQMINDKLMSIPIIERFVTVPATYEQLRIVNVIAFTTNVIITYGMSVMGGIFWSVPTTIQLWEKYQTLVTPTIHWYAKVIWYIVFLTQASWVLQQYFDSTFRSASYYNITHMQYKYAVVCFFQCLYIFTFVQEWIGLCLLSLIGLLVSLWHIVLMNRNGANVDDDDEQYPAANELRRSKNGKSLRYWLEELPFTIHFGWVCFLSLLTINMWFISKGGDSNTNNATPVSRIDLDYGIAAVTLVVLATISTIFLINLEFITVPSVIVWGLWSIYDSLHNQPATSIISQYSTSQIRTITHLCAGISIVLTIGIISRIAYTFTQKCTSDDEYYDNPDEITTPYVPPTTTTIAIATPPPPTTTDPSSTTTTNPNSLTSSYVNVNYDNDYGVSMTSTQTKTITTQPKIT